MTKKDLFKLDAKAKREIRKDLIRTCGYIYTDGVVICGEEKHRYKGDEFRKEFSLKFPHKIPIYITSRRTDDHDGKFIGRLVVHDPSVLLDGIQRVEVFYNNSSDSMKTKNMTCDTVTIHTNSGMKIQEHVFTFMSSNITIQNSKKYSIDDCD